MGHRFFELDEVADYLHLTPEDVREMERLDEIPHEHAGRRLVFRRSAIEAWASRRLLALTPKRLREFHARSSVRAHDLARDHAVLPELLRPGHVEPELPAKTRASVLRAMVELAGRTGLLLHPGDLLRELDVREQLASTALAGGVAMLHPGQHDPYLFEDSFVALGRTLQRIPFGAPDGRTTDLFFLVACQDDRIHLHVLARLCMICHHTDALERLRQAEGAAAMCDVLHAAEREVTGG